MSTRIAPSLTLPLVAALVAPGGVVHAGRQFTSPPPPTFEVRSFEELLAPYGEFFPVSRLGRVWRPRVSIVGPHFVPYTTGGRWVYVDSSWSFESRWPFAWAVFHYGYWVDAPDVGWVWVPGDQWAPAWVEWQYGGGFVAWAPMPPPLVAIDWRPRWSLVEAYALNALGPIDRHLIPSHRFYVAAPVMTRVVPYAGDGVSFGPPRDYVNSVPVPGINPWMPPPPIGHPARPQWRLPPPGEPSRRAPSEPTPPAIRPPVRTTPAPPPGEPSNKEPKRDEPQRRPAGEPVAGVHQMPERHQVQRRHS